MGDGQYIVAASNLSVLVVTINYRLNAFGFLGSQDLRMRATDGSTGNYGIQDQRLALNWVKAHIGAFGGMSSKVTIFGESAGGNSVINHLTQVDSFPLYSKAIIESGTYTGGVELDAAEAAYTALETKTRCTDLQCLLKLHATDVEKAATSIRNWGPVVDGVSLTKLPVQLIVKGQHNTKVPVLLGSNRDEMAAAFVGQPLLYPAGMREWRLDKLLAGAGVNASEISEMKYVYDPARYTYPNDLGKYSRWWWTWMRAATDQTPGLGPCGVRTVARALSQSDTPSVFAYLFAHPTQGNSIVHGTGPGSVLVPHASEIPYVFDDPGLLLAGPEAQLGADIATYWINFARKGDPNSQELPQWPRYQVHSDTVLEFQTHPEGGIAPRSGVRKLACDYWEQHPPTPPESVKQNSLRSTLLVI